MKRVEAYASIITYTQVESLFHIHTYTYSWRRSGDKKRQNEWKTLMERCLRNVISMYVYKSAALRATIEMRTSTDYYRLKKKVMNGYD